MIPEHWQRIVGTSSPNRANGGVYQVHNEVWLIDNPEKFPFPIDLFVCTGDSIFKHKNKITHVSMIRGTTIRVMTIENWLEKSIKWVSDQYPPKRKAQRLSEVSMYWTILRRDDWRLRA